MAGASQPPDAILSLVERYFSALDAALFEQAAACFSTDVFYSRQPLGNETTGKSRPEVRGRPALQEFFEQRGPRAYRHEVRYGLADGGHGFVSGVVVDEGAVTMSFLAEVDLGEDGLIGYYCAYASTPPVSTLP